MTCLGAFVAQLFSLLSMDPNSIFQFFVFPDRLLLVRVGSAFNQLAEVATSGLISGPVGLEDHAAAGLPTLERARELVATPASRWSLTSSKGRNRELSIADLAHVELRAKGWFKRGLHLTLGSKEKLFFRFLSPDQENFASRILPKVLGPKYAETHPD